MNEPKIVGFVQARMGSTRLPGKVMEEIVGRPMLWHVWKRVASSKHLNQAIIVTSTQPRDRRITEFAEREKIPYFAGSETDLLDRYYQAAKKFKVDVIVRVTADCPLVEPHLADEMIQSFLDSEAELDYMSNSRPIPTYPMGLDLELFTFEILEELWREEKDPFRREWFTINFFKHPETYRTRCIRGQKNLSHIRLTVDYKEDLDLIREIYDCLYREGGIFHLDEVLRLLEEKPELVRINSKYGTYDNESKSDSFKSS